MKTISAELNISEKPIVSSPCENSETDTTISQNNDQNIKTAKMILESKIISENYWDILRNLYHSEILENIQNPLAKHTISEELREKTIDWLIEIIMKCKLCENSLFRTIFIMDRYFEHHAKTIRPTEMQGISIACIQLATKIEEIDCLDSEFSHEFISHWKISAKTIYRHEISILKTLNFKLLIPEQYEFLMFFLHSEFITNFIQENDINYEEIKKNAIFLAVSNLFCYKFCKFGNSLKAASILYLALIQQLQKEKILKSSNEILELLEKSTKLRTDEILKISNQIYDHAINFKKLHPGLERIFRFNPNISF